MNNKIRLIILILLTRLLRYNRLILIIIISRMWTTLFSHLHRFDVVPMDGWVVENDADRRTHILGS